MVEGRLVFLVFFIVNRHYLTNCVQEMVRVLMYFLFYLDFQQLVVYFHPGQ